MHEKGREKEVKKLGIKKIKRIKVRQTKWKEMKKKKTVSLLC